MTHQASRVADNNQVLAIDSKYVPHICPNKVFFARHYIRRRAQLFRENALKHCDMPSIRDANYQYIRRKCLANKYGQINDQTTSSCTQSVSSFKNSNFASSVNSMYKPQPVVGPLSPFRMKHMSRDVVGPGSHFHWEESVEDEANVLGQVIRVMFANGDNSRLACSTNNGTVYIYQVTPSPVTAISVLNGHQDVVSDICWSDANDVLLTASQDKTVRVWNIQTSQSVRTIDCPAAALCALFLPANNNQCVVGLAHKLLRMYNVSTGKSQSSGVIRLPGPVRCLCADPSGNGRLWAGDGEGYVTSLSIDPVSVRITQMHRLSLANNCPITSISYSSLANALLVNVQANILYLIQPSYELQRNRRSTFLSMTGLQAKQADRSMPVMSSAHLTNYRSPLRSTFGTQATAGGSCLAVSGSEDGRLLLWSIVGVSQSQRGKAAQRLFGSPLSMSINDSAKDEDGTNSTNAVKSNVTVNDVSFSFDESVLAAATSTGRIVFFKKRDSQPLESQSTSP